MPIYSRIQIPKQTLDIVYMKRDPVYQTPTSPITALDEHDVIRISPQSNKDGDVRAAFSLKHAVADNLESEP